MADMQFEEPSYGAPVVDAGPKGLAGLLIRWGVAKDERQAQVALLVILVVALIGAASLFLFGGAAGSSRPPVPNIDGTPRTGP
ncbi:MAG: hypothetical protein KGI78_00695 [Patescibacteria group bacterium]|nr:hypothetical protein [Patescibacteria group bacterium]MDE1944327.1 hypothetical protein [Patescibacteria group bacterium]MDE1944671.1 hypothetical protein [Patescibacteria group bacterium]MDE2057357.1 hypothetical protein [Patescibacteria group bacterium]